MTGRMRFITICATATAACMSALLLCAPRFGETLRIFLKDVCMKAARQLGDGVRQDKENGSTKPEALLTQNELLAATKHYEDQLDAISAEQIDLQKRASGILEQRPTEENERILRSLTSSILDLQLKCDKLEEVRRSLVAEHARRILRGEMSQ